MIRIESDVQSSGLFYHVRYDVGEFGTVVAKGASPTQAMTNFVALLSELQIPPARIRIRHGDYEYNFTLIENGSVFSDGVVHVSLTPDTLVYERGESI